MKKLEEVFLIDQIINSMNILEFLQGKKTYILAFLGIVWAVSGYFTGHVDSNTAMEAVWIGLMAMTGRAAVSKSK